MEWCIKSVSGDVDDLFRVSTPLDLCASLLPCEIAPRAIGLLEKPSAVEVPLRTGGMSRGRQEHGAAHTEKNLARKRAETWVEPDHARSSISM